MKKLRLRGRSTCPRVSGTLTQSSHSRLHILSTNHSVWLPQLNMIPLVEGAGLGVSPEAPCGNGKKTRAQWISICHWVSSRREKAADPQRLSPLWGPDYLLAEAVQAGRAVCKLWTCCLLAVWLGMFNLPEPQFPQGFCSIKGERALAHDRQSANMGL